MKIVGVGCGPGMLTEQAIAVLRGAYLVYGSERAIALAREYLPHDCDISVIADYKGLRALPDKAVILSTGDPMLAGLGYLPGEVIPGISSVQVAASRLHVPLVRTLVVAAHGRDHEQAIDEARAGLLQGRIVVLIADPAFSVPSLVRALPPATRIAVCEDLGYPEERIAIGPASEPPEASGGLFLVIVGDF
jgi:cobalt-precorrin-7 (C5)-methyltransferase